MADGRRRYPPGTLTEATGSGTDRPAIQIRYGVKGLSLVGGRVLLVKEEHQNGESFWTLPGGGIRNDESPHQALRRECAEEIGCEVTVGDRVGLCPYHHRSKDNLVSIYSVYEVNLESPANPNPTEGILDETLAHPENPPPEILPEFREQLRAYSNSTALSSAAEVPASAAARQSAGIDQ